MKQPDANNQSSSYPIVGRPDVDVSKYLVSVHGRSVIDYEKMKNDAPELYKQILSNEHEVNRQDDIELERVLRA